MKKFKLIADSVSEPKAKIGDIVYTCAYNDYGLSADDTRATGVRHISVTFESNGEYPFFTMPITGLEEITDAEA